MPDTPEVAVARYAAQISFWALGFSALSVFASTALLSLEIRRWFDEGVKLSISLMVDAKIFGGLEKDEETYLAATVTNRGSAATTLTNFVLYNYPSSWAKGLPAFFMRWLKSQRPKTFIVTRPSGGQPLPYVLEPGRNWRGMIVHTPDLEEMIAARQLYVGIVGSHSEKPLLKRALRWKAPEDSSTA